MSAQIEHNERWKVLEPGYIELSSYRSLRQSSENIKKQKIFEIGIYYINTSERPSELSRVNMISSPLKITYSHVKITSCCHKSCHCNSCIIFKKVLRCVVVWSKHHRCLLGNLRLPSEIFGKCSDNVRKRSSSLRNNFGKSSEIFGKWSEIFGKSSKTSLSRWSDHK